MTRMRILSLLTVAILTNSTIMGQDLLIGISNFAWLSGCWESSDRSRSLLISEQWMKPAGTSILGMGRTVKDGRTTDHEFMRIEVRGSDYYFVAQPKANSAETAFKMRSMQPTAVVFENLEHDFPQRVMYRLEKPGSLTARIEGMQNGKLKGINFPMSQVPCDR